MPAWVKCHHCEGYWCNIHDEHVPECLCPHADEWDTSPYAGWHVGEGVSWPAGTDTECGTVVRVTPKSIYVVEDQAELMNSCDSGEPDALKFYPGGFVGHTAGHQRYEFSRGGGKAQRFSLRKNGHFKLSGTSSRGSMSSWGVLYSGRAKHYDYNF